jgi:hypothetical protein
VKSVPLPKDAPPVAAAYQLIVPPLDVAPKSTVPVPQRLPGVVAVIVGMAFTVNVYVDIAAAHGAPEGLFVVTVIVTTLPISPAAGV